jgi:hypothetical protein
MSLSESENGSRRCCFSATRCFADRWAGETPHGVGVPLLEVSFGG